MTQKGIELEIPYLRDVQIYNIPMPLWYSHWTLFHRVAFDIRQHVSRSMDKGGLDFPLTQYENTRRGVETLRGQLSYKKFIKPKGLVGVDEWLKRLSTLINLKTMGAQPIERLQCVRTTQDFLAYYSPFYSMQMELVIYIGSGSEIDGADVIHRPRSGVVEETRDYSLLLEQLPKEVWIEARIGR